MRTLYDVLGLNRLATSEQIESAYKQNIESLTSAHNSASIEENAIRAKAIKEAYSLLSSPARRNTYDASLRVKELGTYQVIEKAPTPWGKITFVVLLIAASICFYAYQKNKEQKERIAFDIQQAKALVERAEQEALAEQARFQQEKFNAQIQAEARRNSEMERARREGNMLYERNRSFDDRLARDQERAKQRESQQAKYEASKVDNDAKYRVARENEAMRRALQMPVGQPNYGRAAPGGSIARKE